MLTCWSAMFSFVKWTLSATSRKRFLDPFPVFMKHKPPCLNRMCVSVVTVWQFGNTNMSVSGTPKVWKKFRWKHVTHQSPNPVSKSYAQKLMFVYVCWCFCIFLLWTRPKKLKLSVSTSWCHLPFFRHFNDTSMRDRCEAGLALCIILPESSRIMTWWFDWFRDIPMAKFDAHYLHVDSDQMMILDHMIWCDLIVFVAMSGCINVLQCAFNES